MIRRHDRPAVIRRLLAVAAVFVGGLIGAVVFLQVGLVATLGLIALVFLALSVVLSDHQEVTGTVAGDNRRQPVAPITTRRVIR